MLRRAICFNPVYQQDARAVVLLSVATAAATPVEAHRGLKTRKRPKIGPKYVKESQTWRETYQTQQQRLLADSLRGYVSYSASTRIQPWDTRFKPFDREETDGVYAIMRHLMKDKMAMSRNHAPAVKRLLCNVGLIGPQVTTQAKWRPITSTRLPERATTHLEAFKERDRTIKAKWYSD